MGEKPKTSSHSPVISDSRLSPDSFISCTCTGKLEIIDPPAPSRTETLARMRPQELFPVFHCFQPSRHRQGFFPGADMTQPISIDPRRTRFPCVLDPLICQDGGELR